MRARIRIAGCSLFLSLAAMSAHAASIVALATYPAAVPSDGSSAAIVVVRTGAAAASVELELDGGGGTVPLVALDAQTFSAILTPAQLLANYTVDEVFRHVVGHFKVDGQVSANFSINVDDAAIPNVPIANVAADMRYSPHVVNLVVSAGDPWEIPCRRDRAGVVALL